LNEDRAARYHRLKRRAAILATLAGAVWLAALVATGASAWLAARATALGASLPLFARSAAVVVFVAALALGWELVSLPFAYYRSFLLERKYGLSSEPFAMWAADHLKALALGLVLSIGAGLLVYGAMALWGDRWWMAAAAGFAVAGAGLSRIAPVALMPIFYRFKPLEREALRDRLLTLSRRAGVRVLGAFEWGLGAKTTRANAALVGAGRTRRILLSDTLLEDYSDDEIEVILAHEMAHHVHHDLWTALGLETLVVSAALYGSHVAVVLAGPVLGLEGVADLAALPLMLLAGGAVSLLLTPLGTAWSRHNERRADRYALELTRRPAAFISAMRRLGAQNLAEERPSGLALWFFHTHPTIDERIAAAREFAA
jgi:STE24 endopeptidase